MGRLGSHIASCLSARSIAWAPLTTPDETWNFAALKEALHEAEPRLNKLGIVDVTLPKGTEVLCRNLMEFPTERLNQLRFLVIGATGHSAEQLKLMQQLSITIPVILVSNFSRGVYLMQELLGAITRCGLTVAELAKSIGFDLGMLDTHHRHKRDAPSGTAVTLAHAAGIEREKIASLRVGEVVGEHSIIASAESEELRLTHIAQSRAIFAFGACELVTRLENNHIGPGFYDFGEILNLTQGAVAPT